MRRTKHIVRPMRLYAVSCKGSGSLSLNLGATRREAIEKWCDLIDPAKESKPENRDYKGEWKIWKRAGYITVEVEMRAIGSDTFTSGRKMGEWRHGKKN